jgi:hypothetical protein
MRTEMIDCNTRKQAVKQAPWAAVIVKVCGGYKAFESASDAAIFRNQK